MNKEDVDPEIVQAYLEGGEQGRLNSGTGLLEYLRTQELLARHLPAPPATIADIGGGAGVYALPLAVQGYQVHLVDPVSLHIEQARTASSAQPQRPLASVSLGDARDLEFGDETMDGVLLLGPLYHLTEREDRLKALEEARRVVRRNGVVVAAAVSRFTSLIDGLKNDRLQEPEFERIVRRDLSDGQHRNSTRHTDWWTTAYFHTADELNRELTEAGLVEKEIVAVEGLGILAHLDEWLRDDSLRPRLLDLLRSVEHEPRLLHLTYHILIIGYRP